MLSPDLKDLHPHSPTYNCVITSFSHIIWPKLSSQGLNSSAMVMPSVRAIDNTASFCVTGRATTFRESEDTSKIVMSRMAALMVMTESAFQFQLGGRHCD